MKYQVTIKMCSSVFVAFILIVATTLSVKAQSVFTISGGQAKTDVRQEYGEALLKLALEKTKAEFGHYSFAKTPEMNIARSANALRWNTFPNLIITFTYEEAFNQYPELTYIRFPVELGLLSYRTCFTTAKIERELANVSTLEELRKYTIGQGQGWTDSAILRHNGFKVIEFDGYDALFKMTAAHRFDLFCRGLNEVKDEYERWKNLEGLVYDKHILIYYPMPLFFYVNSKNTLVIERLTSGLQKAYADGSLQALWKLYHQPNIDFAQLQQRKLFRLDNPEVKKISFDFNHYDFYDAQQ